MSETLLEVFDLHVAYGQVEAVRGVSLSVPTGKIATVIGPNGAGKTTLLGAIMGLLPSHGAIRFAGERIDGRDTEALVRLGMTLVPEKRELFHEMTVLENLELGGFSRRRSGESRAALMHTLDEVFALFPRLQERQPQLAGTLSGGERQMLAVGRALMAKPKLLLLDEPTTGVDPQSRNLIFDVVHKLNRDGMTIIYTSHYMQEVQALCPRIAIMDAGKVIACDTLSQLLKLHPSSLTVKLDRVPDGFFETLRELPGVQSAALQPDGIRLTSDALGPLLPKLALACAMAGVTPTAFESNESTLENVFLQLTGHALRD